MHILIAPDSFKGSISAQELCVIGRQVQEKYYGEQIRLTTIPLADGGEGTLDCLLSYGGHRHSAHVLDPLGKAIVADWGAIEKDKGTIAIIEMAQASGLTCLTKEEYNPIKASTYGTGQLIMEAIRQGCREIYITIGGSATCDGGLGMLEAMGAVLYDIEGHRIHGTGEGLIALSSIDLSGIYKLTEGITFHVAVDVENRLLGPCGAIYTYGPQKGATASMMADLEKGMASYCSLIKHYIGVDLDNYVGGGAAGGLGATLMGVLGAIPEHGADVVMAHSGLLSLLKEDTIDWIITGEGQCDNQTLQGKLPYRILLEGNKRDIPVTIMAGTLGEGYERLYEAGAHGVLSIINRPMSLDEAIASTRVNVERFYQNIFGILTRKQK